MEHEKCSSSLVRLILTEKNARGTRKSLPRPCRPARRLDLPWARTDTVKKAAAKGDADKQQTLL
jgi:hypothetical protein